MAAKAVSHRVVLVLAMKKLKNRLIFDFYSSCLLAFIWRQKIFEYLLTKLELAFGPRLETSNAVLIWNLPSSLLLLYINQKFDVSNSTFCQSFVCCEPYTTLLIHLLLKSRFESQKSSQGSFAAVHTLQMS